MRSGFRLAVLLVRMLVIVFVLALGGCAATAAPAGDAGAADADPVYIDCNSMLDAGIRGLIVLPGNRCIACSGDLQSNLDGTCAARAGTLQAGCRAYCRIEGSLCSQSCAGSCDRLLPDDAGPCAPAQRQCTTGANGEGGVYVCDPTCGANGGCRGCAFNDECTAEVGAGAICQRHCHTCCSVDGDAGVPCSCI